MEAEVILELKGLTKFYGKSRGVQNVSLHIRKGEIFGFLGPNGAGKSTTIHILLDIIRATKGEVVLFGQSDVQHLPSTRRKIGYIAGDMQVYTEMTGQQFLTYSAKINQNAHSGRVQELAQRLDVELDKKIGNLSRGNRQKIALISVFARDTELLVLDEPTSGLDPLIQQEFNTLVREYRDAGGSVLMSSHILSEVEAICDRVAFIKEGEIVTEGVLKDLLEEVPKQVSIVAPKLVLKTIRELAGIIDWQQDGERAHFTIQGRLADVLSKLPYEEIKDITIQTPELEQIFMGYYKKETV